MASCVTVWSAGTERSSTVSLPKHKRGRLRFRALLSENGVETLELARCLPWFPESNSCTHEAEAMCLGAYPYSSTRRRACGWGFDLA